MRHGQPAGDSRITMTPTDLKTARISLKYSQSDMARHLETPLRTYVGWERGETPIPGAARVAVRLSVKWEKAEMDLLRKGIADRIAADWPNGIPALAGGVRG